MCKSSLEFGAEFPDTKEPRHDSFYRRCRCCRHCERPTKIRRANSCPTQPSLEYFPVLVDDAEPPSFLAQWRKEVKPGTPAQSVTSPEDWDKFDHEKDDMRPIASGSRSTPIADIPIPSYIEYSRFLHENRIRLQDEIYPPLDSPQWVLDLQNRMKGPSTHHYIETDLTWKCQTFLIQKDQLRVFEEARYRLFMADAFPLSCNGLVNYYDPSVNKHYSDWYRYWRSSSHKIGTPRDAALANHFSVFKAPNYYKAPMPYMINGYRNTFLFDLLKYSEEALLIQERYQMTEDGTIFPYLIIECRSGEDGGKIAATNQLLASCAAALSCTKRLLRTNNTIFALSIVGLDAELSMMWMDGTMEETGFILGAPQWFRLNTPEQVAELQAILLNIHAWGFDERRAEVAEELAQEMLHIHKGIPRPPASFESPTEPSVDEAYKPSTAS
ncbi:hypothetical protein F4805DRAFT_215104 [Annulohypoxylon moriforme]|nr:hypothetical protein F4805DRAFT_215104 [Annulohypoxylon moriforme]